MTKKIQQMKVDNDGWIYVLLLSTLVILGESLKTYMLKVGDFSISYSIFLLPFAYFIENYIVKKYGFKEGIKAILISTVVLLLYVFIMTSVVMRTFRFTEISGQLFGYLASQLINISVYYFLLNNTTSPYILLFLTYIFSLVVYYMIYMILSLEMLMTDNFWVSYFTVISLQSIICFVLTFIDKHIKRGFEE